MKLYKGIDIRFDEDPSQLEPAAHHARELSSGEQNRQNHNMLCISERNPQHIALGLHFTKNGLAVNSQPNFIRNPLQRIELRRKALHGLFTIATLSFFTQSVIGKRVTENQPVWSLGWSNRVRPEKIFRSGWGDPSDRVEQPLLLARCEIP